MHFAPVISPKVCLLYIDPVTPDKYTFRAYSTICALSGIVSSGTVLYISIISFGPCINPGSLDCKNYGKISLTNYAEKVQFNSLYGQTIDIYAAKVNEFHIRVIFGIYLKKVKRKSIRLRPLKHFQSC